MTCGELYDRLTDLAEGTLQGDLREEVRLHLEGCPDCQAVRQDLADLARLCRSAATASTMPEEVRHRIEVLLAGGEGGPRRPSA